MDVDYFFDFFVFLVLFVFFVAFFFGAICTAPCAGRIPGNRPLFDVCHSVYRKIAAAIAPDSSRRVPVFHSDAPTTGKCR